MTVTKCGSDYQSCVRHSTIVMLCCSWKAIIQGGNHVKRLVSKSTSMLISSKTDILIITRREMPMVHNKMQFTPPLFLSLQFMFTHQRGDCLIISWFMMLLFGLFLTALYVLLWYQTCFYFVWIEILLPLDWKVHFTKGKRLKKNNQQKSNRFSTVEESKIMFYNLFVNSNR